MKAAVISVMTILVLALVGTLVWTFGTRSTLADTRAELASTSQQLEDTSSELDLTEAKLLETDQELEQTSGDLVSRTEELAAAETELADVTGQLSASQQELENARDELDATEQELAGTQSELSMTKVQLDTSQGKLAMVEARLDIAQEVLDGLGIGIESSFSNFDAAMVDNPDAVNPTWQELLEWLSQDHTEDHDYILDVYDCSQFSRDLHNRAEAAGIRAAVVHVLFEGEVYGHALNAFLTSDYGLVYVDCTGAPDKIARVVVGKQLLAIEPYYVTQTNIRDDQWWDGLLWNVGHYYYVTDSAVSSITFFW